MKDGRALKFNNDARPFKRCLSYQVANSKGVSNHMHITTLLVFYSQARKVIPIAISEGRITDDWLDGKNLVFHSPQASKIEVRVHFIVGPQLRCIRPMHYFLSVCLEIISSGMQNYFARIPSSGADPVEDPMSNDPDSS